MTSPKTGEAAFAWLREAMQGERSAGSFTCADISYERLRWALCDTRLSVADRLVRLRHALRYASVNSSVLGHARRLPGDALFPSGIPPGLADYGLVIHHGRWIEALPWQPVWL